MTEKQRISLDPEPPTQGGSVTICYDFEGSGIDETTLRVTFSPDGPSDDYALSKDEPCVTLDVPADAEAVTVEDLDGPSPDKWSPVTPS